MDTVLRNARLVTETEVVEGSLAFRGGLIAGLESGRGGDPSVGGEDCEGDYLLPGLIDLHTDNLEKHFQPRLHVRWPAVPAAIAHDAQIVSAGITTVFDALALIGGRDGAERHETLAPMVAGLKQASADGHLRAEHFLHLRCEVTVPAVLELYAPFDDDPMVRMLSLMDHTPGERQFTDLDIWKRAHARLLAMEEAELGELIAQRRHAQATIAPENRAALAEIARRRGLPLASHDDETVAHVELALGEGAAISEFPTTMTAARAAHERGLAVLAGAPNLVRGGSHSGNIAVAELAEAGVIDVLSSDYVPISLLHATFLMTEGPESRYDLPAAVATVTAKPARAAGLQDRGRLEEGLRADVIRVRVADGLPVVRSVWREGRRVL